MKPKPIADLLNWSSAHPIQTILFTFLFTIIPTIVGFREDWMVGGLTVFVLGLAGWCLCIWRHRKNIVTTLLITSFLSVIVPAPTQAKEPEPVFQPAAVVAVGVVVICVGTICVYKMVKVCQRKFPPKSTNAPPEFAASSTDEYGGAYEYSSIGSCYVPPSLHASHYENLSINPTTFTLNIMVQEADVVTTMTANTDEGTAQTWDQFQSEMAEHGLFLTGRPSEPQFSRGGIPCDGASVPLEFDRATGRVVQRTEGNMRRVVIERSIDLNTWSALLQTDVGVGTGFQVVDTTRYGTCFYRVSAMQP